jgi:hypothetical protein
MSILASLLWIAGFALAFVIPAGSNNIWLPDALLLFGFWPLLFKLKAKWLWLLFGILNFMIGCILEIIAVLSDQNFASIPNAVAGKTHLAEHHVPLVWMGIGILALLIGIGIIGYQAIKWLILRIKRTAA